MKEMELDEDNIPNEYNFENLCYGKGKIDDITTSVYWITHR